MFNAEGKLIGLHHAAGTPQSAVGKEPLSKNEGIRIPLIQQALAAAGIG